MALEGMLRSSRSMGNRSTTTFLSTLCIGLFLTSFAFDGAFVPFIVIGVVLFLLYSLFDWLLYSEKQALEPAYHMPPTEEALVEPIEDGEANLSDDNMYNTIDMPEGHVTSTQLKYPIVRIAISSTFYFSCALITSLGSQLLISACFGPASSTAAQIGAGIVGAAGMLVAGGHPYLSKRMQQVISLCHCAASALGVICWMASDVSTVVDNDVSHLANVSTNIFTGMASIAIVLYAIENTNLQLVERKTHILRRAYKRAILLMLYCLVCLLVHLYPSASFRALLSNNTLSGQAVAARVLWAVGLVGAIPSPVAMPSNTVDVECLLTCKQCWIILLSVLPPALGMAARLSLNASWCYKLLNYAVQVTGGLIVPIAVFVLLFARTFIKKPPIYKIRILQGACVSYTVASLAIFILYWTGMVNYGYYTQASPNNNTLLSPRCLSILEESLLDSSNRTVDSGMDGQGKGETTAFPFRESPSGLLHEQLRCNSYTNTLKRMQEDSVCDIEPIETLFDNCQSLYYDTDTDIAVFRHPRSGFFVIVSEHNTRALLNSLYITEPYKDISTNHSDIMKCSGEAQTVVLIRLDSLDNITNLLRMHHIYARMKSKSSRSPGLCTVSRENNVYRVFWQQNPLSAALYTFTEQPNGVQNIEITQYKVPDSCTEQYRRQLRKRDTCRDIQKSLSNVCIAFEKIDNSLFDIAFHYKMWEWMLQTVDLNEIISQNNNTHIGNQGVQLASLKTSVWTSAEQMGQWKLKNIEYIISSTIWNQRKPKSKLTCKVLDFRNLIVYLRNGQRYMVTITSKDYGKAYPNITIFNTTGIVTPIRKQVVNASVLPSLSTTDIDGNESPSASVSSTTDVDITLLPSTSSSSTHAADVRGVTASSIRSTHDTNASMLTSLSMPEANISVTPSLNMHTINTSMSPLSSVQNIDNSLSTSSNILGTRKITTAKPASLHLLDGDTTPSTSISTRNIDMSTSPSSTTTSIRDVNVNVPLSSSTPKTSVTKPMPSSTRKAYVTKPMTSSTHKVNVTKPTISSTHRVNVTKRTPSSSRRVNVTKPKPSSMHKVNVTKPTPSSSRKAYVTKPTPSSSRRVKVTKPTSSSTHTVNVPKSTTSSAREIDVTKPTASSTRDAKASEPTSLSTHDADASETPSLSARSVNASVPPSSSTTPSSFKN